MRRILMLLTALTILLPATAAIAQEDDVPGMLARIFEVKPKAGMLKEFKEAYEGHIQWHKEQNDDWHWTTYAVRAGEDTSRFIIVTGGHKWEDFDNRGEFGDADQKHYMENVYQYVESVGSKFSALRIDVSRPLEEHASLYHVMDFHLNSGGFDSFNHAITKFHEAIGETEWPANYMWIQTIAGGKVPTLSLTIPHDSWSDFSPMEKPFDDMLIEALGRHEAMELMESFGDSVHCESSYIVEVVPELTYAPAAE